MTAKASSLEGAGRTTDSRDSKARNGFLEKAIVVFIILATSNAWIYPEPGISPLISRSPWFSLINAASYLFTFVVFFKNWQSIIFYLRKEKFIILLVILACLSTQWSPNASLSLQLLRNVIRLTLLGSYLAVRYSLKEQLQLLAWAMAIAVLVSLPLCMLLPNHGFHHALDGCRGIYNHKNHLGRITLISTVLFFVFAFKSEGAKAFRWILFGISFALLVLSNSKTSLLGFFVTLIAFPLQKSLQQRYKFRTLFLVSLTLSIIITISLVAINLVIALESIGKDPTFSARLPLWGILIDKVKEQPLLGYGFQGFWSSQRKMVSLLLVSEGYTWRAGHAHSGFIETALSLGLVGLSLFSLSLFSGIFRSLQLLRDSSTLESLWTAQFLVCFLLVNATIESTILAPNLLWMLYVSIAISLARNRRIALERIASHRALTEHSNASFNR
ncbi:MAG: O-antigen ligase family protein [Leptolyngbya sp. SIO1E4]|nr:O-antigen ligase family protein [Leptolyngbya sp. SIO1E4]